jgi:hypothetical protein
LKLKGFSLHGQGDERLPAIPIENETLHYALDSHHHEMNDHELMMTKMQWDENDTS